MGRVRRWLGWTLVWAFLAGMAYDLVFSDHGYLVYRQEQRRLADLQAEVARLRQQRERLAKEVLRLRHDPRALEELVHRELGYVHRDEFMLIMPDKGKKQGLRSKGSGKKGHLQEKSGELR